ncbi:orc1/cdc6 family replication initiation protein [Streptomyces hoynatensis]|uniref:ORC-CDC6 family AAA ATPase n=1 Tax=Streptomyces hoynatensis TaxID=1141874 RepID=UPI0011C38824|nr:orc1/cdc6 family replication initiation protein [Streptomyces hoynatensis]
METTDLLKALQSVEKRTERVSDEHVVATYVDSGGISDALANRDNGIIYGRRGTGKTHALKYLEQTETANEALVIYIDIERDLGSTEGIYSDTSISVVQRATRLLVDVLGIIHNRLVEEAFDGPLDAYLDDIDIMCDHFGKILVSEQGEVERTAESESLRSGSAELSGNVSMSPRLGLSAKAESNERLSDSTRVTQMGVVRHRVHFGAFGSLLGKVVAAHPAPRFWLLIDEWSGLPMDLQPYLAEMLRRLFFSIPKVSVRIAAIPHRTAWRLKREDGGYIGVEVGAELFPILDLDEFVVFPARNREEQTSRATDFYKRLLTRHLNQVLKDQGVQQLEGSGQMVRLLFTQTTALQELVRAAEGVPRDALLIASRAALRAGTRPISTDHVRRAASQVYQTTKQALLNANPQARQLLDIIIHDVINQKKARAFLLSPDDVSHPLVRQLVDERILHVIKRGYSSKSQPGARFDVLQIDYGCYVQLLQTANAPRFLFGEGSEDDDFFMGLFYEGDTGEPDAYGEGNGFIVPEDDYRAIRRAVLDFPSALRRLGEGNS